MKIVTSFNQELWDKYAQGTVPTFKHFPCEVHCYTEGDFSVPPMGDPSQFKYHALEETPWPQFDWMIERLPIAHGLLNGHYNYNYDAAKFSKKIFALTDAGMGYRDLVFWVDADVIVNRDVPESWLRSLFQDIGNPEHDFFSVSLGREHLGFPHSECGFVGYNGADPFMDQCMNAMLSCYNDGVFFMLDGWHDCFVYDYVMRVSKAPVNNLSANAHGDIDVWPQTVLAEYMTHYKGNRKSQIDTQNRVLQ